jgi:hypothetical protein
MNSMPNPNPISSTNILTRPAPTTEQQKSAEATLSEYGLFQVADNWLDEELQFEMKMMKDENNDEDDLSLEEETRRLEEQLEALPDGAGPGTLFSRIDDEPWDDWGRAEDEEDNEGILPDLDRLDVLEVEGPTPGTYVMTLSCCYILFRKFTDSHVPRFGILSRRLGSRGSRRRVAAHRCRILEAYGIVSHSKSPTGTGQGVS